MSWFAVSALTACSGPFFPVPPPADVTFTSSALTDAAGQTHTYWQAQGGADMAAANAEFYVFDTNRAGGVFSVAMPDGSFVSPSFEGTEGDRVSVYYQQPQGGETSSAACLILQAGGPPPTCPP